MVDDFTAFLASMLQAQASRRSRVPVTAQVGVGPARTGSLRRAAGLRKRASRAGAGEWPAPGTVERQVWGGRGGRSQRGAILYRRKPAPAAPGSGPGASRAVC